MKTIIAGGRNIHNYNIAAAVERSGFIITEILEGGATGIDRLAGEYALANSIPLEVVPADWIKNGRAAGPIRNAHMASLADALILIWDGESKGSASMLREAKFLGLKIHQEIVKKDTHIFNFIRDAYED